MTRKTAQELAAHHRAQSEKHARRAWLEDHPEIKEALAIAKKCGMLAEKFFDVNNSIEAALHSADTGIEDACNVVILSALSESARRAGEKT